MPPRPSPSRSVKSIALPTAPHAPAILGGALLSAALSCGALSFGSLGCSARSPLEDLGGGGSGASASAGGAGGAGGARPLACGASLSVSTPFSIDTAGGDPDQPAFAFGSNDGSVLSVFHTWSPSDAGPAEIHVATLEPWSAWPPPAGAQWTVPAAEGRTFRVANVAYGAVEMVVHQTDPTSTDGVMITQPISATSPGEILGIPLAAESESPVPIAMVRGYDTPPIALNWGYNAMLATWESIDAPSGQHALRMAVSGTGVDLLGGTVTRPDEAPLACANGPIHADGIRSGKSWIVAASAGAPLRACGDGPSTVPSTLAIDHIVWGAADAIDWTLERTDAQTGDAPIESVHMAAIHDGGWVLVSRKGHAVPDLVRVDAKGKLSDPMAATSADAGAVREASIASLGDGIVVAYVDEASPRRVRLEARDREGIVGARGTIDASGDVSELAFITAKDGASVVVGYRATTQAVSTIEISRVGCQVTQ